LGFLNSEAGMRPPAHRGLRLRPGGKSEKRNNSREAGRLGRWEVGKLIVFFAPVKSAALVFYENI